MSRFALCLVVVIACFGFVIAQDSTGGGSSAVRADCNLLSVTLYENNNGVVGPQINQFRAAYTTITYNISLNTAFTTPQIFVQVVLDPTSGANVTYKLPGGNLYGPYLWPFQDSPVLVGPFQTGCDVSNDLTIHTTQFIDLPLREDNCSYIYIIGIRSSSTCCTGVCGDPQFKGLRGQSFQVHGIDGGIYNLISAKDFLLNSEFAFLTGPRECPIMPSTGRRSVACWSHDGSYLKNLALRTVNNEVIRIESGDASTGFASVLVDDKPMAVGENVQFSKGGVMYNTTHELTLHIGQFYIEVENNNGFVNLRNVHVPSSQWASLADDGGIHGLLGQTWRSKHYSGKIKEIEGDVDDYAVFGGLLDSDFVFNRFVSSQ